MTSVPAGRRRASLGALVAAALAIVGCSCVPEVEVEDPLTCFPEGARPWLHVEQTAPAVEPGGEAPAAKTATVYFDRSGSMQGFVKGATENDRPLHDLAVNLPLMLRRQGIDNLYKAFGVRVSDPLGEEERAALTRPDFYSCRGHAEDCNNQEGHLDKVFREVAQDPSGMALVVSDLWFSNSEVQGTALSALAEPLTDILAGGRAVAVYGIPAPFNGTIYHMPSEPRSKSYSGALGLYVIAIGTDAELAAFHESWLSAPSPALMSALQQGRIQRTVYTLRPAVARRAPEAPLSQSTDPRIAAEPLEVFDRVRLQQFRVDAANALRIPDQPGQLPQWTGPQADAFLPDSAWQGRYEPRVSIWERRGTACGEGDWLETQSIPQLWSSADEGRQSFTLAPDQLATGLGRQGDFLIVGELVRTAIERPAPAAAWMREWSFSPGGSPQGGPLHRTLHLSEVARLLENALSDAARRETPPVFGFAVMARMER
jgi:hypothetical protein